MRTRAALLVLMVYAARALAFPLGSGSGSSSSGDTDGSIDGWLAFGAAAIVAGILVWDALRGTTEQEPADVPRVDPLRPTGVDWAAMNTTHDRTLSLGVSVFPGNEGEALARYFQKLILPLEDSGLVQGGDPVHLGSLPAAEQAAIAEDFLGFHWFVATEQNMLVAYTVSNHPAFAIQVPSWDSVSVRSAASEFMEAIRELHPMGIVF